MKDIEKMAIKIRIMAIASPNRDVLSCEFGNWFVPKIEEYLKKELSGEDKNEKQI